jgi:hypothetical protein
MDKSDTDEGDMDESLADSTISLNLADFQKRCNELMAASESSDEAPLEEESNVEQASSD